MKTIDVLIIGSGDMNGQADGFNLPKTVIGIQNKNIIVISI